MKNEILQNINDTSHLLQSINTIDSFEFSAWTKEKANLHFIIITPTTTERVELSNEGMQQSEHTL